MFINIVFYLGIDKPSKLPCSCPLFFRNSGLASFLLLLLCLISFLAFPTPSVWENTFA